MKSIRWCWLMLMWILVAPELAAVGEPAEGQLAEKVEAARSYTEAQRKAIVMKNLDLGKDETAAFWPVYRDYRTAMAKIQDERVRIIADYAENYRSMTDDKAKSLLESYMRTDEDVLKLKRQYLSKFLKGLPEIKVARYYQIENKMDALVAADLAVQIPLVLPTQE